MKHMNIKLNDLQAQWDEIKKYSTPEIFDYLSSGEYTSNKYITRFENFWNSYFQQKYSILTSSGTDAYIAALESLQLDPKNTCVLLQNNTWASILFITKKFGYNYDLIDCDKYFQLSVQCLKQWFSINRSIYKNVVVIPTHILGHPCDMKNIIEISRSYNSYIIEDCSQAHGAYCDIGLIGTLSDIAFWSLYPGKNLGATSQAGIVSTSSYKYAELVSAYINCGMKEKNNFIIEGINSRGCGISAITLYHKLHLLNKWTNRRIEIAYSYNKKFNQNLEAEYCKKHVYHYYPLIVNNRQQLIEKLTKYSIPYSINYPFTLSSLENKTGHFNNSLSYSNKIICLPCHPHLTNEQLLYIKEIINV